MRPVPPSRPVWAVVTALLLARPAVARAQPAAPDSSAGPPASTLACVRALDPARFRRGPVYLHAEVLDSADAVTRPAGDAFAQEAAVRLQQLLRGGPAPAGPLRLPAIDSALGRVAYLEGRVRVVARRGGQVTWRLDHAPGADTAAVALVARALRLVHDETPLVVVDDLIRGDSVAFVLAFAHPYPTGPGRRLELRVRNPTPAFTALLPEERQAGLAGGLPVRYPSELQRGGFEGHVVLQFVVDTTGRALAASVRDANAGAADRLRPELRDAYRMFVRAAQEAVRAARFSPAEVGGCRVRQLVQLPITFALNR